MNISPEWVNLVNDIISVPGVVMVLGNTDVGKTNFCLQLCAAGYQASIPTFIVDADVGQSEIGAPGTISMAIVDKPIEALSDLKPKRLYFVGGTSPIGHMMECAIGVKKMVDAALELGAKLVVVDTTGMVEGEPGRKLKTYKTDLVRPNYLVGIQKRREIEHLLAPFSKIESVKTIALKASAEARRKPTEFRTARRRLNFYNHFHDVHGHIIRMQDVCCWNTWLGTGRPMKWQYMKSIEDALKCKVLHAEITGDGIFIVSERACSKSGMVILEEEFKTSKITIMPGELFGNLLVGLADENGHTLNVGLIQAIDFKQKCIFVLSPMKTISPVRVVQFGSLRVTKEGLELGALRWGEF
ncbi:MAG: Clp1/GlmU family protein [Armatimonadetes bacterium]|nr:Clp1/GlmU family protein [Armatimonadota bacterium]